jgi:primosomal protein N' (replication factor Y)
MPLFCDVALPLPLDRVFTYKVESEQQPVLGGRVLVPFGQHRLSGMVTSLHDRKPEFETKPLLRVLDPAPLLDPELMSLAQWIADYYLAPLGEVFRAMVPLASEFKRAIEYEITEAGQDVLYRAASKGAFGRRGGDQEDQLAEIRVLDYLSQPQPATEQRLRSALRVSRAVLAGMVRKKWISRRDISGTRVVERRVKVAVLASSLGKLNPNQSLLVETLAAAGGRSPVEALRALAVPRGTLGGLVRRGLVEIVDQPLPPSNLGFAARPSPLNFSFNPAQQAALERIEGSVGKGDYGAMLLYGVTGSGKTAVYLAAMRSVLALGRSALLLVPEIGLTPVVAADLYAVFDQEVAILHSSLSDAERAEQWYRIKAGKARIVVGTRSAVFAPVGRLALILVDEEQDASYKQAEMPRYHARDVAVMRAKLAGATVVLGSATPSLESYFNAKAGKYQLLELPDRVEQRPLPAVEVVDMRQEFQQTGADPVISRKLAEEVSERLDRKEQAMILLNRRGYSPVALCRSCGKTMECANCAISLTHHKRRRRMECHYCGYAAAVPELCTHCGSDHLFFLGTGSEKLEELLHGMFPEARIARLDRDTVRGKEDFERTLWALDQGELDLLVGTQMIAKGHDVHGVTLVGVVGADAALGMPDFRAAERTFQLLTQVAGRAGRGGTPGKVVLQTYFPEHYAVEYAARHDFVGFYERELRFRSWMHYPPYSALANVLVRSERAEEALRWSGILGRWFEATAHEGVRVLGPAAAPIVRLKRDYRYHFVVKSASRRKLNLLLRSMLSYAEQQKLPRTAIVVDVDAQWLM